MKAMAICTLFASKNLLVSLPSEEVMKYALDITSYQCHQHKVIRDDKTKTRYDREHWPKSWQCRQLSLAHV